MKQEEWEKRGKEEEEKKGEKGKRGRKMRRTGARVVEGRGREKGGQDE